MTDAERFVVNREAVRKRPGMWIGASNALGRLHLTYEVIENTIDQVAGGSASSLEVSLGDDGSIEIIDDGGGLDLSSDTVRSYFVEHHDTATADGHTPHIHLFDSGVGLFVVNALSERLTCESSFGGVGWRCEWDDGGRNYLGLTNAAITRGTRMKFWPDTSIFDDSDYLVAKLVDRLNEYAALFPALAIQLGDRLWPSEAPDQALRRLLPAWGDEPRFAAYFEGALEVRTDEQAEMRCLFSAVGTGAVGELICYVNSREIREACGFRDQIRSSFRQWLAERSGANPSSPEISYETMDVVLTLTIPGAQFSGPARTAMNDPEVVMIIDRLLREHLPLAESELKQMRPGPEIKRVQV